MRPAHLKKTNPDLQLSYEEMERGDKVITRTITEESSDGRVPVNQSPLESQTIHCAMDNFDHEENTEPDIGGSHETALVLFQNSEDN